MTFNDEVYCMRKVWPASLSGDYKTKVSSTRWSPTLTNGSGCNQKGQTRWYDLGHKLRQLIRRWGQSSCCDHNMMGRPQDQFSKCSIKESSIIFTFKCATRPETQGQSQFQFWDRVGVRSKKMEKSKASPLLPLMPLFSIFHFSNSLKRA